MINDRNFRKACWIFLIILLIVSFFGSCTVGYYTPAIAYGYQPPVIYGHTRYITVYDNCNNYYRHPQKVQKSTVYADDAYQEEACGETYYDQSYHKENYCERITKIKSQWTINFNCNDYMLNNGAYTNIKNVAKFFRDYPETRFAVYGFADVQTGNSVINYNLSKYRANNVMSVMVNTYNIPRERIDLHYEGSYRQIYSINNWNRCVIIIAY